MTAGSIGVVHVQALGALRIWRQEDGEPALTQPRRAALVAYLALATPRGMQSRDALRALFWPEATDEEARHGLRNALHGIRKAVGERVVLTEGQALVGLDRSCLRSDVDDLERDLAAGRVLAALDRYAEPLSGFHISDAPEFERWLDDLRAEWKQRMMRAALSKADSLHGEGRTEEALDVLRAARRVSDDDPRVERRWRDWSAPSTASDREAQVQYVRGTYLFLRAAHPGGRVEDLHSCREYFERALARDPRFAPAVAGLSNYYAVCSARGILRPFAEHFARAIALSHEALTLDASLAIPHVHFGVQAMYLETDWERAEREFACAVILDPLYAEARRFLGILLCATGRAAEGIRELRRAAELEPDMAIFHNSLADALLAHGRIDEAMASLRTALRLDPDYRAARDRLIRCHERTGRLAEAVAERRRMGSATAQRFADALERSGAEGYRAARGAELTASIEALTARVQSTNGENPADFFSPLPLQLALANAELGKLDEALRWEQHAASIRPALRQWFAGRPELRKREQRR
jgi:DNA-binding SARP family transcriptional activator